VAFEIDAKDVSLIDVTLENVGEEHICCAIGNDKTNRERAEQKRDWLRARFPQGHRFLKADLRGKVFIEYSPGEASIYPVEADGYAVIQCFWVSGRYKGHGLGRKLFDACEAQVREAGMKGIVAITSANKRPFMADKKILVHFGFKDCDEVPPFFQLVVKKFDESAPDPRFADSARRGRLESVTGLDFFYSLACPFNESFTNIMADVGRDIGYPVRIHRLDTREDLVKLPTPAGLFSVFLDGEPLSAEVMVGSKFRQLLEEKCGGT
jgi:GNAT superfamily N-acetyltransferase